MRQLDMITLNLIFMTVILGLFAYGYRRLSKWINHLLDANALRRRHISELNLQVREIERKYTQALIDAHHADIEVDLDVNSVPTDPKDSAEAKIAALRQVREGIVQSLNPSREALLGWNVNNTLRRATDAIDQELASELKTLRLLTHSDNSKTK